MDSTRLDEIDKEEWRDKARQSRPDWSDDDFEHAWVTFLELKRARVSPATS